VFSISLDCAGFTTGARLTIAPACPLPRHDGMDRGVPFEVAGQCRREGFHTSEHRLASRRPDRQLAGLLSPPGQVVCGILGIDDEPEDVAEKA
jgi:hypothetical protein